MEVVIVIVEVFFFMVCIVFWFMIVNGYEQRRWWRLWIGKVLSGKWLFEYGGMKVGYGGWRWWFVMCLWVKKTQLCCCYSLFFSLFWVKTLFGKLCVFVVRVLIFFFLFCVKVFAIIGLELELALSVHWLSLKGDYVNWIWFMMDEELPFWFWFALMFGSFSSLCFDSP
jgi:hypothetical protein